MILPGGSHETIETVSEVTELLEAALPDKLFRPPEGYQRVESFLSTPVRGNNQVPQSFREMLETHWQMIKDWFGGKTDKCAPLFPLRTALWNSHRTRLAKG